MLTYLHVNIHTYVSSYFIVYTYVCTYVGILRTYVHIYVHIYEVCFVCKTATYMWCLSTCTCVKYAIISNINIESYIQFIVYVIWNLRT